MIDIYLLEQLTTFAKYGTLTQAARELHITQPALSRSMQKLEAAFGVPLFHRSSSRISLNATGKVAAQYAARVLAAEEEMVQQTISFDRSLRTVSIGSCAALPINLLMPVFQEQFKGMAITSEIIQDDQLLPGLKNRAYQLVILHEAPEENFIFLQKYLDERLCITLPQNHPLASRKEVSFQDLDGMSILAHRNAVFWVTLCRRHLPHSKLLAQDSLEVLHELVDSSSLPAFSSDLAVKQGYVSEDRVTLPITDKAACATYYLACLQSEKEKYASFFRAVCPESSSVE